MLDYSGGCSAWQLQNLQELAVVVSKDQEVVAVKFEKLQADFLPWSMGNRVTKHRLFLLRVPKLQAGTAVGNELGVLAIHTGPIEHIGRYSTFKSYLSMCNSIRCSLCGAHDSGFLNRNCKGLWSVNNVVVLEYIY